MAWLVRRGYWGFDGGFVPVRLPIRDMANFLGIEDGTGRVLSLRSRNVSREMSYWLQCAGGTSSSRNRT